MNTPSAYNRAGGVFCVPDQSIVVLRLHCLWRWLIGGIVAGGGLPRPLLRDRDDPAGTLSDAEKLMHKHVLAEYAVVKY